MTKIEILSLHNFRNNDHFQFMSDVDKLVLTYQTTELGIEGLYLGFKTALDKESTAIRVEQGSNRSKMITELDGLRDNTWNAINTKVKASLLSPIADEAESARLVKRIIDQYGDVRSRSYNEESSAISNLLGDLQLKTNEEHLQKIGITEWVTALNNQNENFKIALDERNDEFADRPDGDVRSIRNQIDPVYQQMVEKINASIVLELAKPAAESFAIKLNEKIKYYKATLAARQGRSKDKDKAAETSTEKV